MRTLPYVLILVLSSFSQNYSVVVDQSIQKFQANLSSSAAPLLHRSGLLRGIPSSALNQTNAAWTDKDYPTATYQESSPAEVSSAWRDGSTREYEIVYPTLNDDLHKYLFRKLGDSFSVTYDTSYKEFRALNNAPNLNDAAMPLEALKEKAVLFLKSRMPPISKRLEYEDYRQEYRNSTLDTTTIRFRRIFNGAIVRKNVSYVEVIFDASGHICYANIKWPWFREIPARDEGTVDFQGAVNTAIAELDAFSVAVNGNNPVDTIKALCDTISGAALGWFPTDTGSAPYLTACYAFIASIRYSNGYVGTQVIDIPVRKKYYR